MRGLVTACMIMLCLSLLGQGHGHGLGPYFNRGKASKPITITGAAGYWFASKGDNTYWYNEVGVQNRELLTQNGNAGQIFTGRAVKFNGSSQYAFVRDSGAYDVRNQPFAISFWMRGTPNGGDGLLIGKVAFSGPRGEWGVYSSSNAATFIAYPASGAAATLSLGVDFDTDSSWHHYIIQIDLPTTKKFYIYKDGTVIASAGTAIADSLTTLDNKFRFYIGCGNNASTGAPASYAKSSFHDIRIFKNKLLSSTERSIIYRGDYLAGATAWFPCQGTSANKVYNCVTGKDMVAIAFNATNSYVSNLLRPSILNKYGYTDSVGGKIIEPDITTLPATKDANGNNLVFKGQAKYNLIKIGTDSVRMPDYIYELYQATVNNIQGWYTTAGVGNHIAKADLYKVQYSTQYKGTGDLIIFNNDSVTVSAADETAILTRIKRTNLVPTKNTNVVWGGCYTAPVTTPVNLSAFTTNSYYLMKNQTNRIRQAGTITKIKLYYRRSANITYVSFCLWRKIADGTYNKITEQNIISLLTVDGVQTITLPTPVSCLEGDFPGLGTASSSTTACFASVNIAADASAIYYKIGDLSAVTNYDWATNGTANANIIPIQCYVDAPMIVGIGNSLMAGQNAFYAMTGTTNSDNYDGQMLNQLYLFDKRFIYQNMGVGGNTSTNVQARFTTDVTAQVPKYTIIEMGVNELTGATDSTTWIAKYKLALDTCVARGIRPVVVKILPWTAGTNAQLQKRDRWNAALAALCASTYPTAIVISMDSYLGQFRAGGDAGNLWDIKTAYNAGDNVHLTEAGQKEWGRGLYIQLNPYLWQ